MSKNAKICVSLIGIVSSTLIFVLIINNLFPKGFMVAIADLAIVLICIDVLLGKIDGDLELEAASKKTTGNR